MPEGSRRPHLIAYDIASPRRWRRLYRGLLKLAFPIQYSLFFAELSPAGVNRVVALIDSTIDARADDVRIYPLPHGGWQCRLGRAVLPDGIAFTGLPQGMRSPLPALPSTQPGQTPSNGSMMGYHCPATSRPRTRGANGARGIEARTQTGQRRGITLIR